jgi:hypothetical protein
MSDSALSQDEFGDFSRRYAREVLERLDQINQVAYLEADTAAIWAALARSAQKYAFSTYAVEPKTASGSDSASND